MLKKLLIVALAVGMIGIGVPRTPIAPITIQAAARPFQWKFVGGDPRCTTQIRSAADSVQRFLSPAGLNDLRRTLGDEAAVQEAIVRVRQGGVGTVILRRGNLVSWDGGQSMARAEIRNLTFSAEGTTVRGPIEFAWANRSQVVGDYPKDMHGWIPVIIRDCCNMVSVFRPAPAAQVPTIPPPPPAPPVAQPSTPPSAPAPVVTPAPAPVPTPARFPLWVDIQTKDPSTLRVRPLLTKYQVGGVAYETFATGVRPLLDVNNRVVPIPEGSVDILIDWKSARIALADGQTIPYPTSWRAQVPDSQPKLRGLVVVAGIFRANLPSAACPRGEWQFIDYLPAEEVGDGVRVSVPVQGETKVAVELRSSARMLSATLSSHCRN